MKKFNPHFEVKFTVPNENGEYEERKVTDPISVRFTVNKNTFQTSNTTHITLYNIDKVTREYIYQDRLLFARDKYKFVTLSAGYGEDLAVISYGYIQQCYHTRQGVDIVTEIDVLDPDILTQYTSKTFKADTEKREAYLNILTENLPNISKGENSAEIFGKFQINTVFDGNAFSCINMITGNHTFIDDGKLITLYDNQTIGNYGVYYISAETGMLETPVRQDAILQIKMLFEPNIKLGQLVEVNPETAYNNSAFTGQFKVIGLNHDCSISNSEGGRRVTTLSLRYMDFLQNSNVALTGDTSDPQPVKIEDGKEHIVNGNASNNVRYIYKYIKEHGGQVPANVKASNRIPWRELIYPAKEQNKNRPADVMQQMKIDYLINCEDIASKLDDFCSVWFPNKKIKIHSAYRTRNNNVKTEGSSSTSNHLFGKAIDFHLEGVTIAELHRIFWLEKNWKYGCLVYPWGLHVSLNPKEITKRRKK